eukprot:NODE_19_length_4547_cov_29.273900_g16_i0.p1 GENE.NODE_19_length_4547_cov_29.273900_g16_i0~~NODE_19_length_4547_cov_29.273900_g16_i0.p1  ORF type:complete len:1392 (+),score=244.93 NODE_19_length_4547_cov_29.273900_g16_i0:167-4342(+)
MAGVTLTWASVVDALLDALQCICGSLVDFWNRSCSAAVVSMTPFALLMVLVVAIAAHIRRRFLISKGTSLEAASPPLPNASAGAEASQFVCTGYGGGPTSVWSGLLFLWLNPFLALAHSRPLRLSDLGCLPEKDRALTVFKRFCEMWAGEPGSSSADLHRTFPLMFARDFLLAGLCQFLCLCLSFVGPLALRRIVDLMAVKQKPGTVLNELPHGGFATFAGDGWRLPLTLLVCPILQSILYRAHFQLSTRAAVQARAGLQGAIFDKMLRLDHLKLPSNITTGSIANHITADTSQICQFLQTVNFLWSVPLQIIGTLYLLYLQLGYPALMSLAVFAVFAPVQALFGRIMARRQQDYMAMNDRRTRKISEFFMGIGIIKLYAWEPLILQSIEELREDQLRALWGRRFWQALLVCMALSTPTLVTVSAFAVYGASNHDQCDITPGKAFAAVSLFNSLLLPMFMLPATVSALANYVVSCRRMTEFLKLAELDRVFVHRAAAGQHRYAVQVHGTFSWNLTEKADTCSEEAARNPCKNFNFSLKVRRGQLCMIVGPVASCKSTLIQSMLGEVPCASGSVTVSGSVAYAAQQACIFNSTLRENILFGQLYERERYQRAIAAAGLATDLEMLPSGDLTEIGERGINLSGGQKQRVSIARALYSDSDIVLLDDPLSALDAHVGQHVMQAAVLDALLGSGKTVVMSTHQLQYLKHAHCVLVVNQRGIEASGTLAELESRGIDLNEQCSPFLEAMASGISPRLQVIPSEVRYLYSSKLPNVEHHQYAPGDDGHAGFEPQAPGSPSGSLACSPQPSESFGTAKETEGCSASTGFVGAEVYFAYIRACKPTFCIGILLVLCFNRALSLVSQVFLSKWADAAGHDAGAYILIYILTSAGFILATFGTNLCWAQVALRGSRSLHRRALMRILRAPMEFFDTTPIGAVLNRFSSDIVTVDFDLPDTLRQLADTLCSLTVALVTQGMMDRSVFLILAVTMFVYVRLLNFYRRTSRELQRLDNLTQSPILTHVSQTLNSLSTIRCFGASSQCFNTFAKLIDDSDLTYLTLSASTRWLGLRVDALSAIIVSGSACVCIWYADSLCPSVAGLALSSALTVTWFLAFILRLSVTTEMQMNSVERIEHYASVETEMPEIVDDEDSKWDLPRKQWPSRGEVTLHRLQCRYRPGLPLVLCNVSATIKGGSRVGVCGRTGSGKSTLLLALFRMIRTDGGHIQIDGIDIAKVPLRVLRERLSIIPQEPTLFAGTVRSNLDPGRRHSDEGLWEALRIAQLDTAVGSLDEEVVENGENFSSGQRQLFCLARAFLKQSQILCLDEATASIDEFTDRIVQNLLRTAFAGKTVITIAHRSSTILDYDSVMVLEGGRLREFDSPKRLLANPNSMFSSLVRCVA